MKRKKSEAADVNVSTADFVQTAADMVGPLAQAAADRLEEAASRIGPLAHDAAERLEPLAHSVADKVAPLAQQAADRVNPLAQQASERVAPYAQQVGGYATQLGGQVGPYAAVARQRSAQAAHDIIERWRPALEDAFEKVSPGIEAARDRINDDLLPKLIAALEAAAAAPVVVEASKRGQATLAAAKGELELPAPKKKVRWVRNVLIVAAVGGVVVVVARKLLAGQDPDWQAARPTAPYSPPKPAGTSAPATNGASADWNSPLGAETAETAEADPAPVAAQASAEQEPPEATPAEGAAPATDAISVETTDGASDEETGEVSGAGDEIEDGIAPDADRSRYSGDDVYIGSEPPEGFSIKANERSMKYHVPESPGYEATLTEVWFASEDAAQEAGFIRAQR